MTVKVTCQAHRVDGFALDHGQWVCRRCGQPHERHETIAETIARKESEAQGYITLIDSDQSPLFTS